MSIFGIIGIVLAGLILLGLIVSKTEAKSAAAKARTLLQELDLKYGDFVEKRINLTILDKNTLDINKEEVLHECMDLIKPEIEGLIAIINSTKTSTVNINYLSTYFKSPVSFVESFFEKSTKNEGKQLLNTDEDQLFESFRDTINSDLTKRLLDLKTGSIT